MNVPKLRFKEFDGEVKKYKIKEVFNVQTGLTPLRSNLDYFSPKYISWIKTLDLNDSLIYETEEHVSELALSKTSLKIVPPNTVLIAMYGGFNQIGRTGLTTVEATTNQAISALIPNENMRIHPYFIQTYLNAHKNYWKSLAASSRKDPNITKKDIEKFSISIPEFLEQQKLGEFFGLLNKKIQLQQQKIDLLQEQKKGYMQKIFNRELRFKDEKGNIYPEWKEGILEDVLFLKLREVPKPKTSYIRLGLRSHAKGTFHQLVTNPEEVSMDKLYVVKKGDLVINITFAWEQALAIAESNDEDKLVSHRFPTYSFKENQYNQFYKYYLTTKYFKYALGNASPGGAGRNRVLNKKDFLKIKLSYPCFKEQSIIADFLDKLDCKVFTELKKLELLQKQKQGFMQQMFI